MIALADNDIVHKLACCQLLPEFLTLLKAPPATVYVLPALPFMVRKRLKNNSVALTAFEALQSYIRDIQRDAPFVVTT